MYSHSFSEGESCSVFAGANRETLVQYEILKNVFYVKHFYCFSEASDEEPRRMN